MKQNSFVWANRIFPICLVASSIFIYFFIIIGITDLMVLQFLTEALLVAPVLIYYMCKKQSLIQSVGIKPVPAKVVFLLIPTAICVSWIAEFVNSVSQLFVTNEIGSYVGGLVNEYPFLITFFVTAVMPAFCEEVVFRGMIYQGYRRYSMLLATILSAALFALMHMNLNQMSYALAIGVCLALVNEAVGSMLPSMLIHLYINGRSTILLQSLKYLIGAAKKEYEAAVQAGDTTLIDKILKDMVGVDLSADDPFQNFLQQEVQNVDAVSLVSQTALIGIFGIVGFVLLLWALWSVSGRKEHMRQAFRMRFYKAEVVKTDPQSGETVRTYEKRNPLSFITVPLILGVAFCIVMMLL